MVLTRDMLCTCQARLLCRVGSLSRDRRLDSEHLLSTAYRSRSLNKPFTDHTTSYKVSVTLNTPQTCGFSIGKSSVVCDFEDVITDLATGVSSDNLPPFFDRRAYLAR